MGNRSDHGTWWGLTASGTNTITLTKAGIAGQIIFITDISASHSTGTALLTVQDGTKNIWQNYYTTADGFDVNIQSALACSNGNALNLTLNALTSNQCYVNISGFVINTP